MPLARPLVTLLLTATLAGCGGGGDVLQNQPAAAETAIQVSTSGQRLVTARYTVQQVSVSVPAQLRVSEANMFYPIADIVWRGDPPGNRHLQVKAIFDEAMAAGAAQLRSGPDAIVEIEITRFHCLTEKARYTVGGVHSLRFTLTVRDAATGAVIEGPRKVVADVKASGGSKAIAEDDMGRTQRIVVIEHLTQVLLRELSTPARPAGT